MKRLILLAILLCLLMFSVGCSAYRPYLTSEVFSGIEHYPENRVRDALDMIDIGFTVSKKPGFALWYDFVPIIPVGVSYVDGYYIGLSGGKLTLWDKHFQRHLGVGIWGHEEVSWGVSKEELDAMPDEERKEASNFQRTGLIGSLQRPFAAPPYFISCPHYIHLGWVGVIGSPRYYQMADFVLGFAFIDLGLDDDRAARAAAGETVYQD